MKAIKLASVFAVSAVAAAVSTTTLAAEAVFSGEAGIEYTSYTKSSDGKGDNLDGTDVGEVEFSVDTGVVYAEVEIATTGADEATKIGMEKLYVKQGDVKFGRFDGSVSAGAYMGMDELGYSGVDLRTATATQSTSGGVTTTTYTNTDTDNTGVRYSVTPELTVALEATPASGKEDSEIGFAASYVMEMDAFSVGVSAGALGGSNAVNLGVQTSVAGNVTLSANYGMGTHETVTANIKDQDIEEVNLSVAVAATDALTLTLQYTDQTIEGEGKASADGTYFVASYTAGDLTYSFENYSGDITTEKNVIGVTASF